MKNKSRRTRFPLLAVLAAALLLSTMAADAAQLVTFYRGQAIVVQSVQKRGSWYYFVLEGGGEVGVPVSRVARIEEYEAPPGVPTANQQPANVASAPPSPSPEVPQGLTQQPALGYPSPGPVSATAPTQGGFQSPQQQPNLAGEDIEAWRSRARQAGPLRKVDGRSSGPGAAAGQLGRVPFGRQPGGGPLPLRRPPQQQNPPNQ